MPDVIHIRNDERKDFASDLDEIAREGSLRMLAQALEAEVVEYIARNQERDEHGRAKVVATALHALGRKTLVVPGFTNRFLYVTGKYLQPRRWSSRAFGRVYRKVLRAKLSESVAPNPVTSCLLSARGNNLRGLDK